jgi:glycosyltransferase involved in cell wall biosynthesis
LHIAIVIPAFNVDPYLGDAIASVLVQTHADWTLVIVDDGSTDATAAVAADFHDARIHLLRQPNAGVSAARNTALAAIPRLAAKADAILFLDGDDWLAPDALALLARTLNRAPSAIAACARFARVSLDGTIRPAPPPPHGHLLEALLTRNLFANGGHLLIRRIAIEQAGEFRPDLRYAEDWEYWTRLAVLGEFAAVPSPAPLLFVRERPGSACILNATDPAACRPAITAIYRNPEIAARLGTARLAVLSRRIEAELAWTVGRELIRHGSRRNGLRWLARSIRHAPTPKRLLLIALFWTGSGPFQSYRTVT